MTYEIVCTRGPMKGRRWAVTPQGLKIGRAEGCEIRVGDVSAELYHCIVKLVGGKPVVTSLASENGVDVNGMYVGEAVLDPMDKINIGGMRFVVSASGSGRGGTIVRKVVPLLIFLALAGAYFYRNRPKSVDVAGKPKPTSESVSTNRVVRIVDELIVTTNRIINIVNNIVVTNYVEDIRRGGVLVSSRVIDMQKPQVAEPEPIAEPAVEAAEIPEKVGTAIPDMYCVIDLSAGPDARKYPVAYYSEPPDGDFNVDEYKTTKLVLQLIKPGSFKMCRKYDVTLTKPFFCGIFEVTQKQYKMVMGVNPSGYKGDKRPVETVSYDMIRGKDNGSKWPESSAVDGESFMGRLRARTGLGFDLPTEAQWEYACRAGTTSTYSYGDFVGADHMWYSSNSSSQTHDVGLKLPNSWGFYDMHGNVWEWCLDWYGDLTSGVNDPVGASTGMKRVPRGGGWKSRDSYCTSFHRTHDNPSLGNNNVGFRLALTIPVKDVERLTVVAPHIGSNKRIWECVKNVDGGLTLTGVQLPSPGFLTIPTRLSGKLVTQIGDGAFRDNGMLTGVAIPGNIVSIGAAAFAGCSRLAEVTMFDGVKEIKSDAFRSPSLSVVTIPASLESVWARAFKTGSITRVNIDSIEHWLSISFGTGGSNPLSGRKGKLYVKGVPIYNVNIPLKTISIRKFAFTGCGWLKNITIPGSVQEIGEEAFQGCAAKVEFANDIKQVKLWGHPFSHMSPDCRICVANRPGYVFVGWEDQRGDLLNDPFLLDETIVIKPRWEKRRGGTNVQKSEKTDIYRPCRKCRGKGVIAARIREMCSECHGKGVIETEVYFWEADEPRTEPDKARRATERIICCHCQRVGSVMEEKEQECPVCHGSGIR